MGHSISSLARMLGLTFQGDGSREIARVSGWPDADDRSLVFLERGSRSSPDHARRAACVIAPPDLVPPGVDAIFSEQPKLDFARAAACLAPRPRGSGLRDPAASVEPGADIAAEVDIGPFAYVASGARIGRGSVLHAGVIVGSGCIVGEDCTLHPRVVLYSGAELGDRVVLHAGVVVGGDGFGYVCDGRVQHKFPQVGRVVIGDDVEVGANTTIDRGSLGVTRVGAGSKIDNLVQIAHNVEIGRGVVIAAQTGISGSTIIEDFAVIGGQVGFGDHARVESGVIIGSKAGVLPGKIVRRGEVYWGVPVRPLPEYKRLNALFGRLPEMKADLETLKQSMESLRESVQKLLNQKDS